MPEDPLAERLSRFTPDGSALDRDALLFAAGRASARPNRGWAALAGALAASQLLTLVLLWPAPRPGSVPVVEVPPAPSPQRPAPDAAPVSPRPPGVWLARAGDAELPPPPAAVDRLVPDAPPLTAFAGRIPADLN
jgi:hypothetical protein